MQEQRVQLLFLLVLFLVASGVSKAQQNFSPEKQPKLKVLSWNIYMLPAFIHPSGKLKRAELIAEIIKNTDYDLLVFQEAFHHRARKRLIEGLTGNFPYVIGPVNRKPLSFKTNSGLLIMSKMPLKVLKAIEFKDKWGLDNRMARKGAVIVEGEKEGKTFQLLATHLNSEEPFSVRKNQLKEIADKLLHPFRKTQVPQIICGDFNIDKHDVMNYREMLSILEAEDGDLEGAIQYTYDSETNDMCISGKATIDYILISGNPFRQKVKSRKIPDFRIRWDENKTCLSDHHPIEAVIDL